MSLTLGLHDTKKSFKMTFTREQMLIDGKLFGDRVDTCYIPVFQAGLRIGAD